MNDGDADALGAKDASDDDLLVAPRPFDRQGQLSRRGLHQDGRVLAHLEGKSEVELDTGVEAVGRMRADLGDEVVEVPALGGLPPSLDAQEEGEGAILGRGDD